jgi:hypothetical protein
MTAMTPTFGCGIRNRSEGNFPAASAVPAEAGWHVRAPAVARRNRLLPTEITCRSMQRPTQGKQEPIVCFGIPNLGNRDHLPLRYAFDPMKARSDRVLRGSEPANSGSTVSGNRVATPARPGHKSLGSGANLARPTCNLALAWLRPIFTRWAAGSGRFGPRRLARHVDAAQRTAGTITSIRSRSNQRAGLPSTTQLVRCESWPTFGWVLGLWGAERRPNPERTRALFGAPTPNQKRGCEKPECNRFFVVPMACANTT